MGLECLDGKFVKRCCENNGRWFFNQFQHFKTTDLWHLNVEKYKIRVVLLNSLKTFKPISAFCYQFQLRVFLQVFFYNTSRKNFVVYNYYFHSYIFFVSAATVAP